MFWFLVTWCKNWYRDRINALRLCSVIKKWNVKKIFSTKRNTTRKGAGNWQRFSATAKVQDCILNIAIALRQSSGEISNRLNAMFSQSAGLEERLDVSPVCEQNSHDRLDNEYCKNWEKYENMFYIYILNYLLYMYIYIYTCVWKTCVHKR